MIMETLNLEKLTLRSGYHGSRTEGVCLLEAVAWMAGEPHTDRPDRVDEVLARFGRVWNDGMRDDAERAQLVPYVAALVGTAGTPEDEARRGWMALDWSVRVSTPAWMDLAGLPDHAARLRGLPQVVAPDSEVLAALEDARRGTAASWDAAKAASWDAAWSAAGAAAGAAAWDAGWDAAIAAAWDAARDAGRDAAWDAARDAASAAAGSGEKLEPTVTALQGSAHRLYLDMIEAGRHNRAALAVARQTVLGSA